MKNTKLNHIVCFGEILMDIYPDRKKIGGAPLNVAAHASQVGCKTSIISAIGNDFNGKLIEAKIKGLGVNTSFVNKLDDFPTGTVDVVLDSKSFPSYSINKPAAWDNIVVSEEAKADVSAADVFLFGTLAARGDVSRESLLSLMKLCKCNLLDLNLRQDFYSLELIDLLLKESQMLKINANERHVLAELYNVSTNDICRHLIRKYDLQLIITTKGADGAEVMTDGEFHEIDGIEITAIDSVGSGDAFLAAFISAYLDKKPLVECLENGGVLGAYVATQNGAIPFYDFKSIKKKYNVLS